MIVGIFAEGRGDLAVIANILKGTLNIDRSDLKFALPELNFDQTDLSVMPQEQHSSWTVVKKVCTERDKIIKFFDSPIEQESFIVIHLDTSERQRDDYNVKEPVKLGLDSVEYSSLVRTNVVNKVNEWLEDSFKEKIAYAIAVEETDAWVLTIHGSENSDTSIHQNPKERLNTLLNRTLSPKEKHVLSAKAFEKYYSLSSEFRKKKKLSIYMAKNESLRLFCESLEQFKQAV